MARVGIGFLLLAIGIATVGVTLVSQLPLWLGAAGWALGGAGIGLAYGAGSLLCFASVAAGEEGEVSGQLQLAEALGTAAGTGLVGALLAVLEQLGRTPRQCHATAFAATVGIALIGAALSGRLAPGAPQRP